MDPKFLIYIFLTFFLSLKVVHFCLVFFKNNLIDAPSSRSSHKKPTPTAGGISFVFTSTFFLLLLGDLIPLISIPLATAGLIDDKFQIRSSIRYFIQVFTSLAILGICGKINFSDFECALTTIFLIFLGTVFINLINFMDGLDGLVGICMISLFLFLSIILSKFYLILIFSILPFLIYNWHPAKIFMGDSGSTFLGAIAFGALVKSNNFLIGSSVIIILSPLFFDASICIMRRLINGQNIFKPHKLHLYQRLHQRGISHSKISMIYCLNTIFLGLICLTGNLFFIILGLILVLCNGVYMEINFANSFKKSLKN